MQFLIQPRTMALMAGVGFLATTVAFGCGEDGQDGAPTLVQQMDAGDECEYGGTEIVTGFDRSGDGDIDDVTDSVVICDGAPGTDGVDGESGGEGSDALVTTSIEEPGSNCEYGGVRVDRGVDEDGSGDLSSDEIEDTQFMCTRAPCATGEPLFFDIDTSGLPDRYADGFTYVAPVETDAEIADVEAFDPTGGETEVETHWNEDEEQIEFEHIEGEDSVELTLIATDGCDISIDSVRLGPWEPAVGDLYAAHMASGFDELEVSDGDADLGEVSTFEVVGPEETPWGDYELEFSEGISTVATAPLLELDPFDEELVIAYEDDGDIEFGIHSVDTSEPDSDQFRMRFSHTDEDLDEVDLYMVDEDEETELLFDDVDFGETTDAEQFDADDDSYLGLDTEDDGEVDVMFEDVVGDLEEAANFEVFVVQQPAGLHWLVAHDYDSGDTQMYVDRESLDELEFDSEPDIELETDDDAEDTIHVSGCGTVGDITMDIDLSHNWYSTNITVYLENPAGDEYPLWSEGAQVGGDGDNLIGNFNNTIDPDAGFSAVEDDPVPISVFNGDNADGDWTLRVWNDSGFTEGTLNSWQLNIGCF